MTTTRIQVGDHDLPVEEAGEGPALIWGHGLTSSRAREDAFPMVRFGRLETSHRVIRYDARGHGVAGGPAEAAAYEWPTLATDQLGLADALGLDTYIAGGVSMGTATALHLAVRHPERIRALVLTAPPTAWETRAGQGDVYRQAADHVEAHGARSWVEQAPVNPIFADRTIDERIPDIPEDLLPSVFRGAANSDLPDPDEIARLTMPVFIQAWAGDPGHPVSTAERLHELLPDSRLYVAEDLTQFKGWTSRIAEFVESL